MSVYTNFIALAKRLIQKYGTQVQWVIAQNDQTTPNVVQTPFVVFKEDGAASAFLRFMQNSNVSIGNEDAFMAQQNFTPTMFDKIVRKNGTTYSIKSLTPVAPGDEIVVWKIELNK